MAQQSYRANLSASIYPMALSRAGRSVIVPQIDQNYDRRVDPTGEQKTPGIPQALYLENVLPTVEGYQSVGFQLNPAAGTPTETCVRLDIQTVAYDDISIFFGCDTGTAKVFYRGTWYSVIMPTNPPGHTFDAAATYSFAVVRGAVFIMQSTPLLSHIYYLEFQPPAFYLSWTDDSAGTGAQFQPVGVLADVVSITGSYGYLLLLKPETASFTPNETNILWSSLLDPKDFIPSLVTGSGGGAVAAAEGYPQHIKATSYGFLIYCNNVVQALYTGNPRYPFRFVGVNVDGPPTRYQQIVGQADEETQVYFSQHRNINLISREGSSVLAPELTEYLERHTSVKDIFTSSTNTFSESVASLTKNHYVQFQMLGNRYIFISTASDVVSLSDDLILYDDCYVFDRLLNRYGRIVLPHTDVVKNLRGVTVGTTQQYVGRIFFVNTLAGTTHSMEFDAAQAGATPHSGVLLLGRFQGVRSRRIILEEVELESAAGTKEACSLHILPSEDGKTFSPAVIPYEKAMSSKEVKQYFTHTEGKNICLLIKGQFDLSTVQMNFHLGGQS